jgi:type I restriction enzyme S subunit
MPEIEIRAEDLEIVKAILAAHLQRSAKVWVFGSRATRKAKRFSDLDLALDLGHPMSLEEGGTLADSFENSDLPYKVDLVDLQTADPAFCALIRAESIPLAF